MGALGVAVRSDLTRVMLVDDSAVVRGMVRKWLEALPNVVATHSAGNGQIAIDTVAAADPHIILLDIEMPIMDGITALPEIVRRAPKAKIIIASTLSKRNAEVTLRAMNLGASDYILKPSFSRDGNDARNSFHDELLRKVKGLSQPHGNVAVPSGLDENWGVLPTAGTVFSFRKKSKSVPRALVIGSSTGGPAALSKVIADAKSELGRVPVFIAQHMPAMFTALLAAQLAKISGLAGGEAVDGEVVVPGRIYVAPGGKHMRVKQSGGVTVIALDAGPAINHCKPAVDPLFESVARVYGGAALGIILTGMGSDGARGALKLAGAGGGVFVQDEKSSIVWGMPGATAAIGAATAIVELDKMGVTIAQTLREGKKR